MFSLTDYVLVTTVNGAVTTNIKPTNFFATRPTVRLAQDQTVSQDMPGNQHVRSDIDRQCYPHLEAMTVRKVFGLTGADFNNYIAYRSWKILKLDDKVNNKDEIVFVSKALSNITLAYIAAYITRQRILPNRFDR